MLESYPNGKKTLWEKEKLLVANSFSFSKSVFKRLVSQGRQKVSLCGNGLSDEMSLYLTNVNSCLFSEIKMPSEQFYLEVVDKTISFLEAKTSVATALELGETEVKLIDRSILSFMTDL